jgi:gluconolactonase
MKGEAIITGLGLLEGPVWRERSGDLIITVVGAGKLLAIDVTAGTAHEFANTDGGPNGAWPCADGGVLVTQNGGLDWDAIGIANPNPSAMTTSGIQRVSADGVVTLLSSDHGPFQAPNDLVVDADGSILFTDPPHFPLPAARSGRIWRWTPGDQPKMIADKLSYCNGIGVEDDGCVVIVEVRGLMRIGADGSERRWLIEDLPESGDGFCFDVEGNIYVAGGNSIHVISPTGEILDKLSAPDPEEYLMTNCCFGGNDLTTLFATGGGAGQVVAFENMPIQARRLIPFD